MPRPAKRISSSARGPAPAAATTLHEDQLHAQGYTRIAGLDEVGRGALAGPVLAAAVVLPLGAPLPRLTDSKKLSASQREALFTQITSLALGWAVGIIDNEVIDTHNILQATHLAMLQALDQLDPAPDFALIDGNRAPRDLTLPCRTVVGGDALCCSIAAASIVAKVMRDALMRELGCLYEGYGFEQHKGYGTREHLAALRKLGPCPVHRRSFAPVLASAQLLLAVEE